MTDRSTWLKLERKVARALGAERNPLSGRNSKHTASDSLHKHLFIETKLKARIPFLAIFNKAKDLAKKENKIPMVVFQEKTRHDKIVMIRLDDFKNIIKDKYARNE